MVTVNEIAPDVYRISIYIPDLNLQFNHFLIKDEEPLLYHTGMKGMFPLVREAVATILEPSQIRWIGASHFELMNGDLLTNGCKRHPSRRRSVVWSVRSLKSRQPHPEVRLRGLDNDSCLDERSSR